MFERIYKVQSVYVWSSEVLWKVRFNADCFLECLSHLISGNWRTLINVSTAVTTKIHYLSKKMLSFCAFQSSFSAPSFDHKLSGKISSTIFARAIKNRNLTWFLMREFSPLQRIVHAPRSLWSAVVFILMVASTVRKKLSIFKLTTVIGDFLGRKDEKCWWDLNALKRHYFDHSCDGQSADWFSC